jgi:hypothetical protein
MSWESSPAFSASTFTDWGTVRQFEELLSVLSLPEYQEEEHGWWQNDSLQDVRKWLDLLAETWRAAHHAGTTLTIDETMIFWTGLGVQLTCLPCKPTPLGVMLKTICDASSRILLGWEFSEGKEVDSLKHWYQDLGAGTSCTLRLKLRWHGTGRVVIGDSWFGSLKCCAALLGMGFFSVLKVKTAHFGFPKQLCLGELKSRNDSVWYKLELEVNGTKSKVFAGGHMDRAPLVLVASCSTSLYGGTKRRYRSRLVGREQERVVHTLEQPKMHALYRNNFNAVDVMNRLSQGPGVSVQRMEHIQCAPPAVRCEPVRLV